MRSVAHKDSVPGLVSLVQRGVASRQEPWEMAGMYPNPRPPAAWHPPQSYHRQRDDQASASHSFRHPPVTLNPDLSSRT
ncbi:hypothetical protein RRG08_019841 [Elysia crispata]|uniref:Uncharacterized protein n=1 Tax=Elysia crispata TaxID=231223 RepID=A0AAE0ZVX8_9GAST|nr:hypothetical protein RRG08_019841 [Elysia crispata]